jgi:hypothetical protein
VGGQFVARSVVRPGFLLRGGRTAWAGSDPPFLWITPLAWERTLRASVEWTRVVVLDKKAAPNIF